MLPIRIVTIVLLALFVVNHGAKPSLSGPRFPKDDPVELMPDSAHEGLLKSGVAQTLRFQLEINQFAVVELVRPSIGIEVVLSERSGRVHRSIGCTDSKYARISEVARHTAEYILQLSACGEGLPDTPYRLTLSSPRAATPSDRLQVKAEESEQEADNLVREYRTSTRVTAGNKYEEAIKSWQRAGDVSGELRSILKASSFVRDLGEVDRAKALLQRALTLSRLTSDRTSEARALLLMATIYLRSGDPKAPLEYCQQANGIGSLIGNREVEAEGLYTLGDIYYENDNLEGAAESYLKAHSIWNGMNDLLGRGTSLLAIAEILTARGEFDQATQKVDEALPIFKSLGDKHGQAHSITVLGNIRSRIGFKQEAIGYYEQARLILQDSGD